VVEAPGRRHGVPNVQFGPVPGGGPAPALKDPTSSAAPTKVETFARMANATPGQLGQSRGGWTNKQFREAGKGDGKDKDERLKEAEEKYNAYRDASEAIRKLQYDRVQSGKLGVDLSQQTINLRNQTRLELTAQRLVQGRNLMEVGGVWIDEGFNAKTKALVIKAQSNAYFKLLEKKPALKDVLRLGNHLVWVAPNGTALVIDTSDGKSEIDDKEIAALFLRK